MSVAALESLTAVCYRCLYSGPSQEHVDCPACGSPMIGQARERAATAPIGLVGGKAGVGRRLPGMPGIASSGSSSAPPAPAGGAPRSMLVATVTAEPSRLRGWEVAVLALGGSVVGVLMAVFIG